METTKIKQKCNKSDIDGPISEISDLLELCELQKIKLETSDTKIALIFVSQKSKLAYQHHKKKSINLTSIKIQFPQ
jgi:hypothetical protein